jgi:rhamnosyltransferase subunit B
MTPTRLAREADPSASGGFVPRNVLLATTGSGGNVYPFIGFGIELRRRGHRVALLSHATYRPLAESAGLDFHAVDRPGEFEHVLANPDLWHPRKGVGTHVRDFLLPNLERFYRLIAEVGSPAGTVMAAGVPCLGARVAQDKLGIPTATVLLAPAWLRSVYEAPLQFPEQRLISWTGGLGKRAFYFFHDLGIDLLLRSRVNAFRASVGLGPVGRVYPWMCSPQRIIGCWPEWYGPPQPDWPEQTVLAGFPFYDHDATTPEVSREAVEWAAARRPIIFTAGTGMMHGGDFFRDAVESCRRLGLPGCLLARHVSQIPPRLPEDVRHFSYVPLSELLPRARAIVHHGGIGTTAQALAAGIPQLVMPLAFDQFDNSRRLARLGVAIPNYRRRLGARELVRRLARLLASEAIARNCQAWKLRLESRSAIEDACDLIEELGDADHSGHRLDRDESEGPQRLEASTA